MGMAASQARYLELTARKTNVEFEGQQINQQRTELANESAGLFAQLMGLSVPTAPSSSTYTTNIYTFSDGNNTYTITGLRPIDSNRDYNYEVTYQHTESVYTGVAQTRTDFGVRYVVDPVNGNAYWLTDGTHNEHKLTQCKADATDVENDKAAIEQIINNTGGSTNFAVDYNNPTPGAGIENIYKYKTASGTTFYYCYTDLHAAEGQGGQKTSLTGYYAANIDKNIPNTEKAWIDKAESGRFSDITLESMKGTKLNLTTTTTTDQNAYQDAMNEYEYQQMRYQQEITNINSKTSIIQAQDKTLELQLNRLDTLQKALSTEMDSVKKVLDKNIEVTFKTFQ